MLARWKGEGCCDWDRRTVERHDKNHEALRDPGFNLGNTSGQGSVVYQTTNNGLFGHRGR